MSLEFKLQDCWIGLYWDVKETCYGTAYGQVRRELHVYVCIVPCVPLHLVIGML